METGNLSIQLPLVLLRATENVQEKLQFNFLIKCKQDTRHIKFFTLLHVCIQQSAVHFNALADATASSDIQSAYLSHKGCISS